MVGSSAVVNGLVRDQQRTIFDSKRLIGRTLRDEKVQEDLRKWPFRVIDGGD